MKTRLVLLLVLTATVLFVNLPLPTRATQESKERIIKRLPVENNEPIEIIDIKVNGQSVSFDKAFTADDDWIRTLVISFKNASHKRILFAAIPLRFPRPLGSKDKISVDDIFYGNWSLQTRPPTSEERLVGIQPGESGEIELSAQQFVDLRGFLTGTKYSSSIEQVDLTIGRVIFEDDTMWHAGSIARRDSKEPKTWIF